MQYTITLNNKVMGTTTLSNAEVTILLSYGYNLEGSTLNYTK